MVDTEAFTVRLLAFRQCVGKLGWAAKRKDSHAAQADQGAAASKRQGAAASTRRKQITTGRRKARCPGFYKSLSNRPGTDLKMVGLARRAEVSSVHLKYVLFAEGRGHYRWSSPSSPLTGGS